MGGGDSQRLLCLNPTTVMVVLLLRLWLLLGCDNMDKLPQVNTFVSIHIEVKEYICNHAHLGWGLFLHLYSLKGENLDDILACLKIPSNYHTRTQLTISDHHILISDDQLGPLCGIISSCNRLTSQQAYHRNSFISRRRLIMSQPSEQKWLG